jgi:hypothetical protein
MGRFENLKIRQFEDLMMGQFEDLKMGRFDDFPFFFFLKSLIALPLQRFPFGVP